MPLIWRFRLSYTLHTPDQSGSSYILNTPPHWLIPVYHVCLNTAKGGAKGAKSARGAKGAKGAGREGREGREGAKAPSALGAL